MSPDSGALSVGREEWAAGRPTMGEAEWVSVGQGGVRKGRSIQAEYFDGEPAIGELDGGWQPELFLPQMAVDT